METLGAIKMWPINVFIISIILVCATGCLDTSIDPLEPSPHDVLYVSVELGHYEYSQCFDDLVYNHDYPVDCDEECCWWDVNLCEMLYCNEENKQCQWKKIYDSCSF